MANWVCLSQIECAPLLHNWIWVMKLVAKLYLLLTVLVNLCKPKYILLYP
jgi:hypothetical protein